MKFLALRIIPVAICVIALACARDESARDATVGQRFSAVSASRLSMGSTLTLTAWTADEPAAKAGFDEVFAEFMRLEKLMSTWIAESDVSRVNREAGMRPCRQRGGARGAEDRAADERVDRRKVRRHVRRVVWPLEVRSRPGQRHPRYARRAKRLPLIDYRAIQIDDAAGTVFLARKGVSMHLGGIGKGYAIDRAAAILRLRGLRDFMVQSGGDIYVAGLKDGRPWRLAIQDPRGPANRTFAELDLTDGTFSTSGDYERYFLKNGRRYHHILDPATGEPARGTRSVTIVSNLAVLADGLSTGVFLMGPDAGMALIERLPDVEGVIVSDKNQVLISSGLKDKLRSVGPPTDAP